MLRHNSSSRQHNLNHFNQINHSHNLIRVKHESIKKVGTPEPVKMPYFYDDKKHSIYHKETNLQNKRTKTPTKYFLKGYRKDANMNMNVNLSLSLRRPATAPQKNKEMKESKPTPKKRLASPMIKSMLLKKEEKMKYDKYRVPSPMLK